MQEDINKRLRPEDQLQRQQRRKERQENNESDASRRKDVDRERYRRAGETGRYSSRTLRYLVAIWTEASRPCRLQFRRLMGKIASGSGLSPPRELCETENTQRVYRLS